MKMLYHKSESGLVPWRGEPINGLRHPPNIEDLWSADELAAVGLYKPQESVVADGFRIMNTTVEEVDGEVKFVHELEEIPAPSPIDFPLSDVDLRLGLIAAGHSIESIEAIIKAIPDQAARETAWTFWDRSTLIHWEHPMTQQLLGVAGFTEAEAAAMWMARVAARQEE